MQTDADIKRCFPVIQQLRTHLRSADEFLQRVKQQQPQNYQLAACEQAGEIQGLMGFRYCDFLFAGQVMYIDDLITAEAARSQGVGKMLLDWAVATAKAQDCKEIHLDSGVQRKRAHAFYLREHFTLRSYHFSLSL